MSVLAENVCNANPTARLRHQVAAHLILKWLICICVLPSLPQCMALSKFLQSVTTFVYCSSAAKSGQLSAGTTALMLPTQEDSNCRATNCRCSNYREESLARKQGQAVPWFPTQGMLFTSCEQVACNVIDGPRQQQMLLCRGMHLHNKAIKAQTGTQYISH